VHTDVTSPLYYQLRDYGVAGQLGLEARSRRSARFGTDLASVVLRLRHE